MTALGHIRDQPTLEVPVVETGELLQECPAEADLEVSSEA